MSQKKSGILVTGTHRSGTTWMGRILTLREDVVYIREPFNLGISRESIPFDFEYWFPHTEDIPNRDVLYQALDSALRFRYAPKAPERVSWHRALRMRVRRELENRGHRANRHLPLLKDPIALLSAPDLAERFDLNVVCMIRHPLAFCSSIKKWDWKFPFDHFLKQPRLMERHFADDRDLITRYAEVEQPIVDQAILLWNLFHKVIRTYQADHPDWDFRRHEDMVANPMDNYRDIYQNLGIEFTDEVADQLRASLSAKSGETNNDRYKARDASTVTQTWKSRLDEEEVNRILEDTMELRRHFYPEDFSNPAT